MGLTNTTSNDLVFGLGDRVRMKSSAIGGTIIGINHFANTVPMYLVDYDDERRRWMRQSELVAESRSPPTSDIRNDKQGSAADASDDTQPMASKPKADPVGSDRAA